MKKYFGVIILALMAMVVFFGSLPIYAGGGNLDKAGQQALKEKEDALLLQKTEIEAYLGKISDDRVVTKDEMMGLWDMVDDFTRFKNEADVYLKVYDLKTQTDLAQEIKETVGVYCTGHALIKRDVENRVKVFFASWSGKDVIVETGLAVKGFEIGLIISAVLGFFLILLVGIKKLQGGWVIPGVIMIVLSLIFMFL